MKKQGRIVKHKFWSEFFDYPINKKGKNNLWVSYPVFDLKQEHDSWKSFASGLIWIE